jgi:cell division protein FtsN
MSKGSRDYSKQPKKRGADRKGSTFVGILIGLVLGLSIALAVAWYINKMPNPFKERPQVPPPPKTQPTAKVAEDKGPRFTFPEILKGEEKSAAKGEKAGDKAGEKGAERGDKGEKASTPVAREAFFLQAGSFQNAPDADNLKARLALVGVEASIQTTNLPDKGVWHRVRVGPYTDVEELNRIRTILKQNGIESALVKVREAEK